MADLDLVRTARGLEQSGPGPEGEHLKALWRQLTASSAARVHAVEQTILRWLLKRMNDGSPDSETIRRYPLTWMLLDCVFARIPLFSLAKSLADRKFIAILRKVYEEISASAKEGDPSTTTRKRKRSVTDSDVFELKALKTLQGSLLTAKGVFGALKTLLDRTAEALIGSHDNIGAEHIKSIFATATSDSISLVAPSLEICHALLSADSVQDLHDCEHWIWTLSSIWELHPHSDDDAEQVARELFRVAAPLLDGLKYSSADAKDKLRSEVRRRWTVDLEQFLHQSLASPAKSAFLNRSDLAITEAALNTCKSTGGAMTHILYAVLGGESSGKMTLSAREAHTRWMQRVFQIIEPSFGDMNRRELLVRKIMTLAKEKSLPIRVDDLRGVCNRYALDSEGTDWELLALIAQCNPGIFQTKGSGHDLLQDVCSRIRQSSSPAEQDLIAAIIKVILQGFCTARDVPAFLKLWYTELCNIEEDKRSSASAWFRLGRGAAGSDQLLVSIEQDLSAVQLREVVDWLGTKQHLPEALCVFCATLAQAVESETHVDALDRSLFDLVASVKSSKSPVTALKWRIVSRTLSWARLELRQEIWTSSQKYLSKILTKSPIDSPDTYEAFKCCSQAWLSMSPDDDLVDEPASLARNFQVRLFAEGNPGHWLAAAQEPLPQLTDEYTGLSQYLVWILRGPNRLSRFTGTGENDLPSIIPAVVEARAKRKTLEPLLADTMLDETRINCAKSQNLVDQLVDELQTVTRLASWPNDIGRLCIHYLDTLPIETFRRPDRERIMSTLDPALSLLLSSSLEDTRMAMSLVTRLMKKPTYWDGMSFRMLDKAAKALSSLNLSGEVENSLIFEQIEKFAEMASTTVGLMIEDSSDRGVEYLKGISATTETCRKKLAAGKTISPFHAALLTSTHSAMKAKASAESQAHIAELHDLTGTVLASYVATTLGAAVDQTHNLPGLDSASFAGLFVAVEAAEILELASDPIGREPEAIRKCAQACARAKDDGNVGAWKLYTFFVRHLPAALEDPKPISLPSLDKLPRRLQVSMLKDLVKSVTRVMQFQAKLLYLEKLVDELIGGCQTDAQILAIQCVVEELCDCPETPKETFHGLDAAYGQLIQALPLATTSTNFNRLSRTLYSILDKRPQSIGQWNVEHTLSTVCTLATNDKEAVASYTWMCKLVEAIIKKHRLRVDGRYHILIATLSALLRDLIRRQQVKEPTKSRETLAFGWARLITLIREPTAGAVARSHQSSLDSAMDLAKRAAGRHMYLVLIQYVQLQLENEVPKASVTDVLEPAMHSIFDVLSTESRRITNDAMDVNGRAILREMYKRYKEVGKWSGI